MAIDLLNRWILAIENWSLLTLLICVAAHSFLVLQKNENGGFGQLDSCLERRRFSDGEKGETISLKENIEAWD